MLSDLFEQLVSIQMKTTQGSDGQAYCTWPDAPEGYSYALWGKSKTNTGTGLLATLEVHMTGQSLLLDVDFATALTAKGPCST